MRCTRNPCPLKEAPRRASPALLLWVGGVGAIVIGGLYFNTVFASTDNRTEKSATTASAPQESDGVIGRIGSEAREWASSIGLGGEAPTDAAPSLPAISLPDPQAALRVASFSCSGDVSGSRAQICTHMDLAVTDYNLSLLYTSLLAHSPNRATLQRAHAAWLRELDALGDDHEKIQQHYKLGRDRLITAK